MLLADTSESELEEKVLDIVTHYNLSAELLTDQAERLQVSKLNLQAAQATFLAAAFDAGLDYAKTGIELLGEDAWEQRYRLTLELQEQAALLAHAAGNIPAMKQHCEQVLQHGCDPLDQASVQKLHIEFLLSSKQFDEAIEFGLDALSILEQDFLPDPDWAFTTAKLAEFLEHLEQVPPDYLSMPRLYDQDPELFAVSEILLPLGSAAYISRPALAPLIIIRSLELSLERQLLPEQTPVIIAAVGVFANALLGNTELAHTYGKTAVELASRAAFHTYICAPLHIHALHNYFWRKPLRETLDLFERAVQSAYDSGNHEYASYAMHGWSKHALYASIELAQVEERSVKRHIFLEAIDYVTMYRWLNIYLTAVQALRGNSSAEGITWRDTPFDDDKDFPDLQRVKDQNGLLYAYSAKAWIATLFGDHNGVKEYSDLSHSLLMVSPTGLEKAILTFVCGLRYSRELRFTPESSESKQALEEQIGLLKRFAGLAPMNFAHKLALVQAEVHRAHGEVVQAMQSYEKASQGASENGYLNEAGLVHTLAAEFYQDLGLQQAVRYNVEQAAQIWQSWGAHALVESLSMRFPDLLRPFESSWEISSEADKAGITIADSITPIKLDMDSIISASQMLSTETDLEQLLTQMITLVMANSGAETAVLLLKKENDWFVQARGDSGRKTYDILLNQPFSLADSETALVPEHVFNYCQRSKELVVLSDARKDSRFAEDKLIIAKDIKSALCLPILNKGEIIGLLYLENNQMTSAFNTERIELLKHFASQFGISVENALLYVSLQQKVSELKKSEKRYDLAVSGSAAGIWDWDIINNELYTSERLKELWGFAPYETQITMDDFWDRLHPEDSDTVKNALEQHLKNRVTYNIEYRIQTKSGEYLWFHARGQALWNDEGEAIRMSGSLTDITPRKVAEEELIKSEEHFRKLMEQSPLAIAIFTPDGQFIDVNPAWYRQWGLNREEATEFFARYNLRTDKQLEDLGVAMLVERAYAGENVVLPPIEYIGDSTLDELSMKDVESRTRWVQCHLYPIKDENRSVTSVVNTNVDITELKNSEDDLRKAYEEIEQLKNQLEAEREHLQDEIKLSHNFEDIIGNSEALKYVLSRVEQVAPTESPVLIMGETGTGKELMARAIHDLSPRKNRALIKVNCAALPRELIESELFGHEKGAFTGAASSRQGRFEVANGSTLFLDEIGEMPLELQAKLLRVLESGEYERLGSSKTLHSDARIIVATNRVLEEEVKNGRFRKDLWYRLKVFPITVPPLRERPEDLPLLVKWLTDKLSRRMGKSVSGISKATMKKLQSYSWPGNVRELEHIVENALITSSGGKLNFDLPVVEEKFSGKFKSLEDMERDYILDVLKAHEWRIGGKNGAVNTLKVPISTLRGRMARLGIKKPKSE
jgi:chemotaxis protein methyltransferase CheR